MGIPVKINVFEGPLDLLLHLIDKHKLDIYDINIVEITEQYLKYIDLLEANKLDVMSEFIDMAATLISIKTKMLLPKPVEEEEEGVDPRQALIEKLIEYRKFKLISGSLRDRQKDASQIFYKGPTIPEEVKKIKRESDPVKILDGMEFSLLYSVFQSVMKKRSQKVDPIRSQFGEIKREVVSVDDKITYIRKMCQSYSSFSFRDMLLKQFNKTEVIVTFLAVLELMKMGDITIVQDGIFDDIYIELKRETA